VIRPLSCLHERQTFLTPHVVDDLKDARAQWRILDAKLLREPAVVDEVVARLLPAPILGEGDLGVGQKLRTRSASSPRLIGTPPEL